MKHRLTAFALAFIELNTKSEILAAFCVLGLAIIGMYAVCKYGAEHNIFND